MGWGSDNPPGGPITSKAADDARARVSFLEVENRSLIQALASVQERLDEAIAERDEARDELAAS